LLRAALLVIGGVMLAAAAIGALAGCRLAVIIPLAVWGAILAGGLLVERWRYQGLTDDRLGRNWQATPERFVDPETGAAGHGVFQPGDWRAALRRRCRATARVPELTRRCRFSRDGAVAPAVPPCIRFERRAASPRNARPRRPSTNLASLSAGASPNTRSFLPSPDNPLTK